jgi:hypothetical protein
MRTDKHASSQRSIKGPIVIRISTALRPWFGQRYRARSRVKAGMSICASFALAFGLSLKIISHSTAGVTAANGVV